MKLTRIKLKEMIREEIRKLNEASKVKVGDKVTSAVYQYKGQTGKVVDAKFKEINGKPTLVAVVDFGDGKPVDHEIRRLKKI
ncbi:hypothetical protein CL614_01270 [archaeon]|nr:hypothetical protein [archaeon]|tara:strand:- start:353 stop:598 length:246 start_codon:yes stop_codon:yes gene_type:complete